MRESAIVRPKENNHPICIDSNAFYSHIGDEGFTIGLSPKPNAANFGTVVVSKREFSRHGHFQYFQNAERFWIGGMQSIICRELFIVTDDYEELFVFYMVLNNWDSPVFLGKLLDNTPLHSACMKVLTNGEPSNELIHQKQSFHQDNL